MRKKIHQIPKPKFKVGEICVVNKTFDLISICDRRFGKHGHSQWIYYIKPFNNTMLVFLDNSFNRAIYYDSHFNCIYTIEEHIEKLSDEQKVELL